MKKAYLLKVFYVFKNVDKFFWVPLGLANAWSPGCANEYR